LVSPIQVSDLIQFLEADHNLMIFADSDVRKPVRTLANEFGVDFEPIVNLSIMIKWFIGIRA
jgi:ABC-type Zn uptake system ZnuABC Zn-binding protein ZnuA